MNAPRITPVLDDIAAQVGERLAAQRTRWGLSVTRRASRFNQVDRYLWSGGFVVEVEIVADTIQVATDDTTVTLYGRDAFTWAAVLVTEALTKAAGKRGSHVRGA